MITINELFSGIGSQKKAFTDLELPHRVECTAEIDKDAMLSYAAIHYDFDVEFEKFDFPNEIEMKREMMDRNIGYDFKTGKHTLARVKGHRLKQYYLAYKLSKNEGDISKIEKLPYADFWTYSFPCFVEGTLVLTLDGYKPIEEVTTNDLVLTHTNTYQKVKKTMINKADSLIKLKTMCSETIYTTAEHPFYVRKKYREWNNLNRSYDRKFTSAEWVKAKDLSRDYYVGTAINQVSKLPQWNGSTFEWADGRSSRKSDILVSKFSNSNFWWLIGRYLGDGWIRSQGGIIICCDFTEIGQIVPILDELEFNYSVVQEKTVAKIHIAFKEIGEYCEQFGRGASNKCLSADILNLPINLLKSFLDGYLSADGCFTQNTYKITSVSRELIYGIGQCVAKAYHRPFSVYFTQRPKTHLIEGRIVNQKDSYTITYKLDTDIQDKAFYEDGYVWSPINSISECGYSGLVYNIETENDNSYVVQNIIVHNCTDISVAGNQEGIKKGTRSGLLFEVERLLNVSKEYNELPKYLMLENVKNLVGKKFKADFNRWLLFLEQLGKIIGKY